MNHDRRTVEGACEGLEGSRGLLRLGWRGDLPPGPWDGRRG